MAEFDVRGFDDDGANHTNDFNPTTDEGWFVPADFGSLGTTYPFFLKHYNTAESAEIGATGTGLFNPFLNMNGDSTLLGFNTNDDIKKPYTDAGLDISDPNTDAIQLGDIPIIYRDLDGNGTPEAYYVINLDINENVNSEVSLEELQIFTSSASATLADYHFDEGALLAFENNAGNAATDFTLRFDLDTGGDNKLIMRDDGAGQGKLDYTFYFPVGMFAGASPNDYLTLFSQFGPIPPDDAGFAEWNVSTAAKIAGIKFKDVNGDGSRDVDGADNILGNSDDEVGLAGFTMYIDLNGNNKLDANEQTAVTDANGNFLFASLLPNATYVVREVLTTADVNGPGDPGPDVTFATYAPPAGLWDQTTDDGTGDQVVNVTTGTTNILVGNMLLVPSMNVTKSVVSVTNGNDNGTPLNLTDDKVDGEDNVINYSITIANTGNVTLSGVTVDDKVESYASGPATYVSGDANTNGLLDVGETWTYSASYDVTQADIDNNGGGDGTIDNVATGDTAETPQDTDDASVAIIRNPAMNVTKSVVSVTNGNDNGTPLNLTDDKVDGEDNVINYSITIANTGNVTLSGVTVDDKVESYASGPATYVSGDANTNGLLDVGETWTYSASYDVTQADIDNNGGGDGTIDNVATGDTAETPQDTDDASVAIIRNPGIDIEKSVKTDVNGAFVDADDPDGPEASTSTTVDFKVVLTNTGNVTLTDVAVSDTVVHTVGGVPGAPQDIDYTAAGAFIDLDHDGILDVGVEEWSHFDTNGDGTLDVDENGDPFELSVGESVTIYYSLTSALGQHENTAVVTTGEGAGDNDDANYFVLPTDDCVGVRTPGFWANTKWMTFWDGKGDGWNTAPNEPSQAGTPGFADGELLYGVDSNHDGFVNHVAGDGSNDDKPLDAKGLLIGDYNMNGITDAGEDTIFISYNDAIKLINASSKQLAAGKGTADGIYMLGRDMVATWLNYLANNSDTTDQCIGGVNSADGTNTPREYLDAAIDWMQQFASNQNSSSNGTNQNTSFHDGDTQATFQFDARVAPSSSAWQTPFSPGEDIPVSGAALHAALDGYNNTGAINGIEYCCDADSEIALIAIAQII
jgi:hypothetical protein